MSLSSSTNRVRIAPPFHGERPPHATTNTSELQSQGGGRPLRPPIPIILACTRFNNKTWQEYQDWKHANQQIYEQIYNRPLKCIYGAPREISHKKIPPEAQILVIEMNNDANRIMGIGEIQNKTASEVYRTKTTPVIKFNNIFSDRNYARYIYIGNSHYATREELERNHTPSAQYINEHLASRITMTTPQTSPPTPTHPSTSSSIEYLERILFKGQGHMKRGSGVTKIKSLDPPRKTQT
jgi:hypothetical protein